MDSIPLAFPVPRPVALDLDGSSDDTQVRAAEQLTGRVEFGGPVVAAIDSSYDPGNVELQAYLKAKSGSLRFALVIMSVHFPYGQPDLATASVEVSLTDSGQTGQTLAYSLFPQELSNAKDANRSFTIKPDLTIAGVSVSLGEATRGSVEHGTEPYVIGGPELSAHPSWSFRQTAAQKIAGSARLGMVIQVPADSTGSLSVTLRAAITERHLFSRRQIPLEDAGLGNPTTITF